MITHEVVFLADLIAIFSIYLIINLSLNLEFGFAGIPNFGKVLSVGAGAFVMGTVPFMLYGAMLGIEGDPIRDNFDVVGQINAHAAAHPEAAFLVMGATVAAAMGVGMAAGLVSSYPAIRLRGDYLAITLLAFGEMIRIIGMNHEGLVGGTLGVGVPDVLSFVADEYRFLVFSLALLAVAGSMYLVVARFTSSPVGRLLRATRDDETAVQSLGRDVGRIKMKALMLGGLIGAVGGLLYASYVEGVVAFSYNRLNWTFLPFVMVVVGGMANNKGVLLGTLIFVLLRKLIIFYNDSLDGILPFDIIWLDYLMLGGIMIVVLLFRPRGLLAERPQSL